jgi:hypothetical protein
MPFLIFLSNKFQSYNLPAYLRHQHLNALTAATEPQRTFVYQNGQQQVCMSSFGLFLFVAMGMAMVAAIVIIAMCVIRPQGGKEF